MALVLVFHTKHVVYDTEVIFGCPLVKFQKEAQQI